MSAEWHVVAKKADAVGAAETGVTDRDVVEVPGGLPRVIGDQDVAGDDGSTG